MNFFMTANVKYISLNKGDCEIYAASAGSDSLYLQFKPTT